MSVIGQTAASTQKDSCYCFCGAVGALDKVIFAGNEAKLTKYKSRATPNRSCVFTCCA